MLTSNRIFHLLSHKQAKKGLYSAKHPLNVKRQIKAVKMKEQSEDEDRQGAAEGFSLEFFL